ncbi:MAG: hypothetical protein ABIR16_01530 [Dokdonella sp.]
MIGFDLEDAINDATRLAAIIISAARDAQGDPRQAIEGTAWILHKQLDSMKAYVQTSVVSKKTGVVAS